MAFQCPSIDTENHNITGSSAAALQNGQLLRATSQQKDEQQNWNRNSQQPKQNVPRRTTVLMFLTQAHVPRSFLCLLIRMRNETHVLQTMVLAYPLFAKWSSGFGMSGESFLCATVLL